jgi:ribonuclease Y
MMPMMIAGFIFLGGTVGFLWMGWQRLRASREFKKNLAKRKDIQTRKLKERIDGQKEIKKENLFKTAREVKERLSQDNKLWLGRLDLSRQRREKLQDRHQQIDRIFSHLNRRKKEIRRQQQRVKELSCDIEAILEEQMGQYQEHVGVPREHLQNELLEDLENHLHHENQMWIRRHLEQISETKHELAEDFIDLLINRLQLKPTVKAQETRVRFRNRPGKKLVFPDSPIMEKVKELCQVELLFDKNEEGILIVSAFDGVARERGVRLLDKIIRDNKSDLAWIEKQHEEIGRRLAGEMTHGAGSLLRRLKIDDVDIEIVRLQGRIRYRTSFGQNVLDHQLEVGFLCGMLGLELGDFNLLISRKCGFFHDIGKAIDVVQEGSHPELGGDFLKKHSNIPEVIQAAYNHHNSFNPDELYTAITSTCDAMSAGRPGARRESIDSYVERLETLEQIARQPEGVQTVAVMQAGRKIQVSVDAKKVADEALDMIGKKIAAQIEGELVYPGEIQVNVFRETSVRVVAK